MKHSVSLDYDLAEGWLRPWFDGLREGRAVASTCSACDLAQFPPLRVCPMCNTPSDGWRTLSGGATVQHRTAGADGDFAIVQFDGAERAAVVRSEHLAPNARRGRLARVSDGPPWLSLEPEDGE